MRIVLACDKFKGSLTAAEVCMALERGLRAERPDLVVERVPVADGGDGTLVAALEAGFTRVPVRVTGPTGEPVDTAYARSGDVAVVEMADASGLSRLPSGLEPLTASPIGTGELMAAAIDAGCTSLVLGVGGSSSTDGGAGLVVGLGGRVLDAQGSPVPLGGAGLERAASLDLTALRSRLDGVTVTVASDVDNPLCGPRGAAAVYGPQKGATPGDVRRLDAALSGWADLVAAETGRDLRSSPGAGAAGGAGFAAMSLLGADLRPGIETMLELAEFEARVVGADLVITGEGSLDAQSLHGKAPVGVASAAARHGVPVVAVCGVSTLTEAELAGAGITRAWALFDLEPDPARSMAEAALLLERVAAQVALTL
ncbi:glycerate kinase [uncultured Nocardioides sp.]|uniref:glycerate kinase n=1 Tax=uncultured Nocardioides sp. TaxID=198441 RepID=UPI002601EABB|nr:glycerate kinase [uncultured Nocardioides sp.]